MLHVYHESLVKPKITGLAYVTGYNQIVLDDHDPFQGRASGTDIFRPSPS